MQIWTVTIVTDADEINPGKMGFTTRQEATERVMDEMGIEDDYELAELCVHDKDDEAMYQFDGAKFYIHRVLVIS